ncbi:MAG: cell division protein FtsA [Treponema sp.]|nr:cell division protein FtsA [Treponema sp.]
MNDDRTIVGLDIGSNVIKAAIGKINEEGKLEIVATSSRKSAGLRNGVIVNIEEAKDAIKETIEDVEQAAGTLVDYVICAIGGSLVESESARGVVPIHVNSKNNRREVTRQDIDKVIEIATAMNFPADREKIHVIPQNYLVDGVSVGIQAPLNRLGYKLEADVLIVTASKTIIQNMRSCMLRADYILGGVMLKTLAQTQSVCHDDELELGSIIIDLGAGTTDVIVLIHGAPVSTASIPVGGNFVTNDIGIVTGIPFANAEKIKIESGCCWLPSVSEDDEDVILPGIGGRAPELLARSQLCQIIQARMEQIFSMVKTAIINNTDDKIKQLSGNIILTGGGAMLPGVVELAQAKFKTSAVRIGIPDNLGGKQSDYRRPDFATVIGLIEANKLMPQMNDPKTRQKKQSSSGKEKDSILKRMRDFFF